MARMVRGKRTTSFGRLASSVALAVFVQTLFSVGLPAAQTLADADWFERELAQGVVWKHYVFDDLFSSLQSVSYVEVDLDNPDISVEIPYLANSRQRISSMIPAQAPGAVAGINGTYFDTSVGGHRTYLRVDGAVIPPGTSLFSPWGYEGALALDASDVASIVEIPGGGWSNDTAHPTIIACGPLLIVDSVIPTGDLNGIGSHCTSRHPRSAVGITADNHLILLTVDGRTELASGMTCVELANVMDQLGCSDALNYDGGGSTTLWGDGEPFNGVINSPSDNGFFDHSGERSCSNAIAIGATIPASPVTWDARITGKTFTQLMETGSMQTVSLTYQNIGTGTWTAADTRLVLARPVSRTSIFHVPAQWPSSTQPALMTPATVPAGGTATFTFPMQAPFVSVTTAYDEHFMLTQTGVGRIGPADSEAWMRLAVQPPVVAGESFIVESRPGGQNFAWYSDVGMADTGTNCTAPDCTGNIGMRYGSTFRSVAGSKSATVAPDFPAAGDYRVYVAWGTASNRRTPITYHVNHAGGSDTFQIDQTSVSNIWVPLGTEAYRFEEGFSGSVVMTNENIDVSGSMYAGGVMFVFEEPEAPDKSHVAGLIAAPGERPVIDGVVSLGEWDAASPAASGFVVHSDPNTPAEEDGSFRMLHDGSHLYTLFEISDPFVSGYPGPTPPYGHADLPGDKFNLYLAPLGVDSAPFYRVMLCPNPTDGICYLWSQASTVRTTDPLVGTDWVASGEAAFTHTDGVLTIEHRIPWSAFDYPGMGITGAPVSGAVWGLQVGISNQLLEDSWEYVNWEPDLTPSYILGNPLGALIFGGGLSANGWTVW